MAFLLDFIPLKKGMRVLDIGCGKGDAVFYLANKGIAAIGIDYAREAIKMARQVRFKNTKHIQGLTGFRLMNAKELKFKDNALDAIIAFDIFEHLYKKELEEVMREISRVLKKDGILLVHTEANKIYLNLTHKYYVYPVSQFLILLNRILTGRKYPGLPQNPRSKLHKIQHVNEPTYFYLRDLFRRHHFGGRIISVIPFKPLMSLKDFIYNLLVWFFPLSKLFPFYLLFAYDFVCIMKNKKR